MRQISKLLILISVASLYGGASAQRNTWTIGVYTGVQGQINTSISQEYFGTNYYGSINKWNPPMVEIKHTFSAIPPVELAVKYNVGNRFSIASGVGYKSYYMKAKYYLGTINNKPHFIHNFTTRDDFIQVSNLFQYDIPLKKKGFSLFVQGGICLDFEIYENSWGYFPNEYHDIGTEKVYSIETSVETYFLNKGDRNFNLLLHAGIGFSYLFNSGIGISLLGRYNVGALYISTYSYHTILKEVDTGVTKREMKEQLYCKGESWNVLLGVTYTFKKKEKKSKNTIEEVM